MDKVFVLYREGIFNFESGKKPMEEREGFQRLITKANMRR